MNVVPTEGDAVRPLNVIGHQGEAMRSIQPALLYFGLFAPVGPVHEAKGDTERLKKPESNDSDRIKSQIQSAAFAYLLMGSTTMARGFSRFAVISVFLLLPSVAATEMVFKVVSVQ